MTAIAFPQTPSVNDTFTSAGRSWRWTGTRWSVVAQPISPSRLSSEGAEVGDALVFDGENYSPVPIEISAVQSHPANATPISYIRVLTQAEYDALGTYDSNTLYFIQ
jgi:hypothetical protein